MFIAGPLSVALAQTSGGPAGVKPSEPASKKPPAGKTAATSAATAAKPEVKKPAEELADDEEYEEEEPPPGKSLSHLYQFGLAVRAGTGYKTIAPYDDGQDCGNPGKRVCGSRQPVWLEISPSFGVTKSLELLVDVRLTLEADFADTKAFYVSPGIKYFTTPHDLFKFFLTGQLVFDYQDMDNLTNAGLSSFDFAIRSALGLHFDVHKNFGFYLQGGIIFGFVRWLTFTVDGGAGIQVRY